MPSPPARVLRPVPSVFTTQMSLSLYPASVVKAMVPATVGVGGGVPVSLGVTEGELFTLGELDVVTFEPPQAASASTASTTSTDSTPTTIVG